MAQPFRLLNRNVVQVQQQQKFLVEKINDMKPFDENNENNTNANNNNKNNFVSKIPVFKSRIGLNNLDNNNGKSGQTNLVCGGGKSSGKLISCTNKTTTTATNKSAKVVEKPPPLKANNNAVSTTNQTTTNNNNVVAVVVPKKKLSPKIENIDSESNCFLLSDYAKEIYEYLHELELDQALPTNFLSKHNVVTPSMRAILVNWVIGMHKTFHMCPETLYLSISIIDRVLSRERIEKNQLQLLGAAAFFVASKYEEVYYPDVKDFVLICDNLYTKKDILKMELRILKITNFELSGPSPLHFLRRGSKAACANSRVHLIGKYLCELSMIDYQCAHWLPSLIASTALYIALRLVKIDELDLSNDKITENELKTLIWNPTIEHYTGYSLEIVHKHSAVICRLVIASETSKHQNCRKKYLSSKFMNISNFSQESMKIIKKLANQ